MDPVILIAVADESLQITYGLLFAEQGFRVVTASGGLECLNKLCRVIPEVLILDKELLWGGGEGVLEILRTGGNTRWPPVVLLTHEKSDGLPKAQPAPVVVCLRKPVVFGKLLEEVEIARRNFQYVSGEAARGPAMESPDGVSSRHFSDSQV